MVSCAVANCKNTSAKISKNKDGITFHRFPRDKRRKKQWELAVNREEEWSSTASSAVCSEHFEAKDFYLTESGLRRLSVEAVPAINISYEPLYKVKTTQGDWRTVVQAPEENYVQMVRLESCKQVESPCFTGFKMPFGMEPFCKQKYNVWEFLVHDGKDGTEKVTVDLPVCCSCHYKNKAL